MSTGLYFIPALCLPTQYSFFLLSQKKSIHDVKVELEVNSWLHQWIKPCLCKIHQSVLKRLKFSDGRYTLQGITVWGYRLKCDSMRNKIFTLRDKKMQFDEKANWAFCGSFFVLKFCWNIGLISLFLTILLFGLFLF